MLALACDHGGFDLKPAVIEVLDELGVEFIDLGTYSTDSVDYPVYGEKAARAVADGQCDRGIVLCGTGIGISIVANKVAGVRCAHCTETYSARMSRQHNDANMLAMGSRVVGTELAKDIVRVWLTTEFEGGDRHTRRVGMINALDEKR